MVLWLRGVHNSNNLRAVIFYECFEGPQVSVRAMHIHETIVRGTLDVQGPWNEVLDGEMLSNVKLIAIRILEFLRGSEGL